MDRWFVVRFSCFGCTFLVFEIINLLPILNDYYHFAAKIVFCLFVAHWIFVFTQDRIFTKRINPENKAVFITGCDSGFGYHLAKLLDSKGYHVFAGCLFPSNGGIDKLKSSCSHRLRTVHVDVTKDDSVQEAKEFIQNNLGQCELWAVVNNAGVYKGWGVEFSKMSEFQDTMEVNALGQVRVTKAFLPLIRKCKGRIINVNSLAGRAGAPNMAAYSMSKFASVAFTDCLRREMDSWGVKVIAVEPEFFKTPLTNGENLIRYLEVISKSVDDAIKMDYGEKFMKQTKIMMGDVFSASSPNINLVTEAIEAAVSMEHPCLVYKPSGNQFRHVMRHWGENLPDPFLDYFFKLMYNVWRIPSPDAVRKNRG